MNVSIRRAVVSDIEQIHKLGNSAQEFTVGVWEGFWSKDNLLNWSKSEEDLMLVAVNENNEVIGFSLYAVHIPTGKVTWENLFVSKECRQQGIGKKLVLEGLKELEKMGYNYVALQNHNDNQDDFASYLEQFGFKRGDMVMWMDKFIKP
ncbi:MAG: GNAT family N-acetyltransferase [Minisyncoccia bacterium]